jgi:hypothetical protein
MSCYAADTNGDEVVMVKRRRTVLDEVPLGDLNKSTIHIRSTVMREGPAPRRLSHCRTASASRQFLT